MVEEMRYRFSIAFPDNRRTVGRALAMKWLQRPAKGLCAWSVGEPERLQDPRSYRRNAPAPDQAPRGWWHPVQHRQGAIDGTFIGRGLARCRDQKFHLPPAGWSPSISRPVLRRIYVENLQPQRLAPLAPTPRIRGMRCEEKAGQVGQDLTFQAGRLSKIDRSNAIPPALSPAHRWHRSARRGAAIRPRIEPAFSVIVQLRIGARFSRPPLRLWQICGIAAKIRAHLFRVDA